MAYADANGLDVRILYGGKARLKRKGVLTPAPARLVRVEHARSSGGGAACCRAHFRNGVSIEPGCAGVMRPANVGVAVYLCLDPVGFRKQINGVTVLVQDVLALDPFCEQLLACTDRRRDRVKVL